MSAVNICIVILLSLCGINAIPTVNRNERKNYTGYKVLEILPADEQTVKFLRNLMLTDDTLDFWSEPSYVDKSVQIMVPPERLSRTIKLLENSDIRFTVYRNNVQDALDKMWKEIDERYAKTNLAFDIDNFNNYEDISSWMDALTRECRAGLSCQRASIGNSFESRPIYSFRITKPGVEGRKLIYIDATIHAREWISTATTLKMLDALARGSNDDAVRLTEQYDWLIIPVVNPDGYHYTWTSDRYWRKNRRAIGVCYGTDLNRNYDAAWGTDGVSNSPCSNVFCGPSAGSEPETQAMQREIRRIAPSTKALITIHSKGQMWMFSWGYTVNHAGQTCLRSYDHFDLMPVADAAANAVQRTYNTVWTRGNSCEVIYATSGSTMDFAKGTAGIKFTFTLELRGDDWIIDRREIDVSYNEVWNGVVAMVDALP